MTTRTIVTTDKIGVAGGVAALDDTGKIPTGQLPSGMGGGSGITNLTVSEDTTTVTITPDIGIEAVIPSATPDLAGVQSAADKAKLDGIAAQATRNSADEALLSRANHTGTQAISTVEGLPEALTGLQVAVESEGTSLAPAIKGVNLTGSGVSVTVDSGGIAQVVIPGNSSAVTPAAKQMVDFTLSEPLVSKLVPVAGNVNINIADAATSGLAVGYALVLCQDDTQPFTVVPAPGVIVESPNGLVSVGQFTTAALIQVATDVWLMTIAGTSSSGGSASSGMSIMSPSSTPGVIFWGGGDGTGTFTQSLNHITVSISTGHGLDATLNGMGIVLPRVFATGATYTWGGASYEVGTDFTYIDPQTFTFAVTSSAPASGAVAAVGQYDKFPLAQITIAGTQLGSNGFIRANAAMSQNGTGNDKTFGIRFGDFNSVDIGLGTTNGSNVTGGYPILFQNMNSPLKQAWRFGEGAAYSGSGRGNYFAVDTTVDFKVTVWGQLHDATDYLILDSMFLEVYSK